MSSSSPPDSINAARGKDELPDFFVRSLVDFFAVLSLSFAAPAAAPQALRILVLAARSSGVLAPTAASAALALFLFAALSAAPLAAARGAQGRGRV
eukprot:CAMPEP_0206618166 /NCGR_PEP_ID=MMETSP0325_2-20121206/60075_1 /ASSEMBLY_ACC=CAM_ASM_000347 /TAXON_ID=2866 /ORGANISM="Crypthecodinium cohnii, Strain Seligo" /LENGTH=95 /DNA_ID=CAMNT_0054140301 /DNA_START=202 /DNA_END=485 /DNA_ORIENTATION=-